MSTTGIATSDWETLFRTVFERSLNPILLFDERRQLADANDAAVQLLGYSRSELLKTPVDGRIREPTKAQREEEWKELLSVGMQSSRRVLVKADGTEIEVEFASSVAKLRDRTVVVAVVLPHGPVSFGRTVGSTETTPLTEREREIVTLIALGRDTGEMAAELHISPATVRTHVRNAMAKLGVHTRAQLVAVALCGPRMLHAGQVMQDSSTGKSTK